MQQRAVLTNALLSGSWVPGASTTGSQLHDGDCIDHWQNLTTQP